MKTDDQWLADTIALFRENDWDNFCHIMAGWPELTEEEILSHYEPGNWEDDDDDGHTCTVCSTADGEVCRDAFECDAKEVYDNLAYSRLLDITELQVQQFMDVSGLNSNVESISTITDIIEALLDEWEESDAD